MKSIIFATPVLAFFCVWWILPWTGLQLRSHQRGHRTMITSQFNFGTMLKFTEVENKNSESSQLLVTARTRFPSINETLATENQTLKEEVEKVKAVKIVDLENSLIQLNETLTRRGVTEILVQRNKTSVEGEKPLPSKVAEKEDKKVAQEAKKKEEEGKKEEKVIVSTDRCSRKDVKFFNSEGKKRPRIGLISYPRSGNSMTRVLMERLTGIWTGSYPTSPPLIPFGFLGEGYIDESVSAIKYHAHQNIAGIETLQFDKFIYLVRNPFDSFLSRMNKLQSNSHNKTVKIAKGYFRRSVRNWIPEWQNHVQLLALNLTKDSKYMLSDGRALPVLLVRYEDIVSNATICFPFQTKTLCSSSKAYQLSRIYDFLELPTTKTAPSSSSFSSASFPSSTSPSSPTSSPTTTTASTTTRTRTFVPEIFIGLEKTVPSKSGNETLRTLQEGQRAKAPRNVRDFSSHPLPLTVDRLHCVTTPEPTAGYTPRKKQHAYAVDTYPADERELMIRKLKTELCALGYTTLSPTFQISCDQKEVNLNL